MNTSPSKSRRSKISVFFGLCVSSVSFLGLIQASHAALMQVPYQASGIAAPPLVLLTMSRDEKLVAAAYNDYSDIDGDGFIDIGYKTDVAFKYFGNFSSELCYEYVTANERFEPIAKTANKKCSGSWSGDFLNYVTTSRVDALRRALYGGLRYVDDPYLTVLERAYVPQDAHVWGKEYDPAIANYLITDYTPLPQPAAGRRHLLANVTLRPSVDSLQRPRLRILTDRTERIWNWVLKEGPVADDNNLDDRVGAAVAVNYTMRNIVCSTTAAVRESDCKSYPGNDSAKGVSYKPTGILHDYGENRSMAFGLVSGSWANHKKGGVLRRNIEYFDEEIDATTGVFKTSVMGIARSVDRFRIAQFDGDAYDCNAGNYSCVDWANPVAEMMYEGLRYLAGGTAPTPSYDYSDASSSYDKDTLGLSKETWKSPWRSKASGGFPACSKPIQMVVSDIKPTFDSDDLPGAAWGSFSAPPQPSVLSGLNVKTQGDSIWSLEGLPVGNYFIGHSLANQTLPTVQFDQSPSLKRVESFGNIRGLPPEGPSRQGTYNAAAIARYGKTTNLADVSASTTRNVDTYAIALSTPLPDLRIPVGSNVVTILPVGQSVSGCNFGGFTPGTSFPTNRITGFYITDIANVPGFKFDTAINGGRAFGAFRVGFEDNEEGTDNDMDAIVIYQFRVLADGRLEIYLESEYAAGCIGQHIGFVISGTTEDGKYLGVRDVDTAQCEGYFPAQGDDPANSFVAPRFVANGTAGMGVCVSGTGAPLGLGTAYRRAFTPSGTNTGGDIPKDPLWYAVKYGGPKAPLVNGTNPSGYFLVTNPGLLRSQLAAAFSTIVDSGRATSANIRFTGATARSTSLAFSPRFEAGNWSGGVEAFRVNSDGTIGTRAWSTATANTTAKTNTAPRRNIRLFDGTSYVQIGATRFTELSIPNELATTYGTASMQTLTGKNQAAAAADYLNYLMGDRTLERAQGGPFRDRGAPVTPTDPSGGGLAESMHGDVVNSTVAFQGRIDLGFAEEGLPESTSYATFVASKTQTSATVYFGSNDGMLHAVDANTGVQRWAFVPRALGSTITDLANPGYAHRYFVDGQLTVTDAYLNGSWRTVLLGSTGAGGKSVFAFDVTSPSSPALLWELTSGNTPELGNVLGKLTVSRTSDTTNAWWAFFSSGYESAAPSGSSTSQAALIAVPLRAPANPTLPVAKVIKTPVQTVKNGLGTPTVVTASGKASGAWAGDLNGNLWRFNLDGLSSTWAARPAPIFTAVAGGKRQPITAAPAVADSPSGGDLVIFGTGKFFEDTDPADVSVQSVYGIRDPGNLKVSLQRSNLTGWTINETGNKRFVSKSGATNNFGWYADLTVSSVAAGERVVATPLLLGGNAYFSTVEVNGSDPCIPKVNGWIMAFDFELGSNPLADVFGVVASGSKTVNAAGTRTISDPKEGPPLGEISAISTAGGIVLSQGGSGVGASSLRVPDTRRQGRSTWKQFQ
ncbi:MAG: hypothetical protein EAZ30_07020 [Betaproteobacteria bacterium]|nr:MAG: hypothetical protein EAZ30_07020 [Betaproteobacteria bacterium]